jgi:uncharacterized protein (UPF0216 family)
MSEKDKVFNLLNDGVKRSSKRIAQELNRPIPSVRRDLQELLRDHPMTMHQSRDPHEDMLYWRV